jgi:hypothetical protein
MHVRELLHSLLSLIFTLVEPAYCIGANFSSQLYAATSFPFFAGTTVIRTAEIDVAPSRPTNHYCKVTMYLHLRNVEDKHVIERYLGPMLLGQPASLGAF